MVKLETEIISSPLIFVISYEPPYTGRVTYREMWEKDSKLIIAGIHPINATLLANIMVENSLQRAISFGP